MGIRSISALRARPRDFRSCPGGELFDGTPDPASEGVESGDGGSRGSLVGVDGVIPHGVFRWDARGPAQTGKNRERRNSSLYTHLRIMVDRIRRMTAFYCQRLD